MTWKIPLFKMYWDDYDISQVNDAIRSGMNWASGPLISEFEQKIAEYIGTRYCLTFNSGTSALHAILLAHDIKQNDEVIVPSFTFIATANAPKFVGAKPVFADIEKETFGISPEDVKEKITKRTRVILPVHYGGCPCKIKELREIADEHDILLIEDAAEAFGSDVDGKKIGTFGNSAMLSFCQNKIITTGEGGAVVTDSRDLYEKMKLIRSHGRLETENYFSTTATMDYISLGYNFRISSITAALGLAQIKKVDTIITKRRRDAMYYMHHLQNISSCTIFKPPVNYHHVYQLFSIMVEKRDELIHHLETKGIMTKIYFHPIHLTHYYKNILKYNDSLPVTEQVANEIISLPFYPGITRKEIDYVIQEVDNFYKGNKDETIL